ncbi:hypothetical protein K505DRAFT_259292, partial [Melanomma pulvis-pyrius CBS 109.77]
MAFTKDIINTPQSGLTPEAEIEVYECDVCLEDFSPSEGVIACSEHFFCRDCAIQLVTRSLLNVDEFPVKCCLGTVWSPSLFEYLLPKEIMTTYMIRLRAYNTPQPLRVFCANAECARYISPRSFDNNNLYATVACCSICSTTTCVGCKKLWKEGHNCDQEEDPRLQPSWLPPYTTECRIKRCPGCGSWLEHKEACNHMTCDCRHQFCFICLQPWEGFHEGDGCPSYGDPPVGYDDEGYEKSARGLHRLTGLTR